MINLDRATERLAHMKKQMAYLKLPFTRIHAVDGKSIEKYKNEGNAEAARGVVGDVRI